MATSREFTDAAKVLAPYIEMSDRHALVSKLLETGNFSQGINESNPDYQLQKLAMELYELVEGGTTIDVFMNNLKEFLKVTTPEEIENLNKKIMSFIRITPYSLHQPEETIPPYLNGDHIYSNTSSTSTIYTLESGGISNADGDAIISDSQKLYAVEMLNPRLGMQTRDTAAVGIFMSLISPLEMSRCVPHLNVKIRLSSSYEEQTTEYSGLSLLSYLNGRNTSPDPNTFDYSLSFDREKKRREVGLELFTSPQTLISSNDSLAFSEAHRGENGLSTQPVLDRFRPFMSLKGMSFSVVPTKGFMCYKSGKLELILHDRSRLADVAYFVKPGLYSAVEFEVEYGWSHPGFDASVDVDRSDFKNPIGAFLNAHKIKERYGVVNSTFSFEDNGQVNISLTLAMKGASELGSYDISTCSQRSEARELKKMLESISKIVRSEVGNINTMERLFGDVVMTSVGSVSSLLSIDPVKLQDVKKTIATVKKNQASNNNPQLSTLANKLDTLFDQAERAKSNVKEAIRKELTKLQNAREIFPFHDDQIGKLNSNNTISLYQDVEVAGSKKISAESLASPISLGRILLSFVGKPLLSSERFEEVQFIFHTFNDKCTFMRDLSIAKFPIPYSELNDALTELIQKNESISISQFIGMINSRFIGNQGSKAYGMNFLYEKDAETGELKRATVRGKNKEDSRIQNELRQDAAIDRAGIKDGTFKLPKLSMYPECVGNKDGGGTILRMHVIDETCVSFSMLSELLNSSNSLDITKFGFTNDPMHPTLTKGPELNEENKIKKIQETLNELKSSGLLKPVITTTGTVNNAAEVDVSKLLTGRTISQTKKMVSRGIPTIVYGREGGTIKSIGLQSLADPKLSTINILRMEKTDGTKPDVMQQVGLPMQVSPTECSIEMMGNPFISFMQQFFIDFNTGTGADTLYNVTGIEHKIDPGSFTTSLKLLYTDAYAKYTSNKLRFKTASSLIKSFINDHINEPAERELAKVQKPQEFFGSQLPSPSLTALYEELKGSKYKYCYFLIARSENDSFESIEHKIGLLANESINESNKRPIFKQTIEKYIKNPATYILAGVDFTQFMNLTSQNIMDYEKNAGDDLAVLPVTFFKATGNSNCPIAPVMEDSELNDYVTFGQVLSDGKVNSKFTSFYNLFAVPLKAKLAKEQMMRQETALAEEQAKAQEKAREIVRKTQQTAKQAKAEANTKMANTIGMIKGRASAIQNAEEAAKIEAEKQKKAAQDARVETARNAYPLFEQGPLKLDDKEENFVLLAPDTPAPPRIDPALQNILNSPRHGDDGYGLPPLTKQKTP